MKVYKEPFQAPTREGFVQQPLRTAQLRNHELYSDFIAK